MILAIRRPILVLFCLAPFVGVAYAGWNLFQFHGGTAPKIDITDYRNGAVDPSGDRVTLAGGGLTWCSHLVASPDGDPKAYWIPYIADTTLEEVAVVDASMDQRYPFDTIIFVKLTPEQFAERYPAGLNDKNIFLSEEFTGVLHLPSTWPGKVAWFRMQKQIVAPKLRRAAFFEIGGTTMFVRRMNVLALISGLFSIPAFFVLRSVRPAMTKERANENAPTE